MDIAATLGAERLRELMTELVECSGVVVARYGGTVNQFTGDGFMALFGAPIAMEDHARAGVPGRAGHPDRSTETGNRFRAAIRRGTSNCGSD